MSINMLLGPKKHGDNEDLALNVVHNEVSFSQIIAQRKV